MRLELLNDLIGINNSSDFLQLPERLLIIAEFLPLVILIMLVAGAEDIVGFVVGAALDPRGVLILDRDVFVHFLLLLADVFCPHFLDGYSPLLEAF